MCVELLKICIAEYTYQNCTKINLREAKFQKHFLGGMPADPPTLYCMKLAIMSHSYNNHTVYYFLSSIVLGNVECAVCLYFYSLEEGGQTALGPALLVSILLASKKAGSKVIDIINEKYIHRCNCGMHAVDNYQFVNYLFVLNLKHSKSCRSNNMYS